MLSVDTTNHKEPRFINRHSRDLDQVRIIPDRLRLDEVDPVLFAVRTALPLVIPYGNRFIWHRRIVADRDCQASGNIVIRLIVSRASSRNSSPS